MKVLENDTVTGPVPRRKNSVRRGTGTRERQELLTKLQRLPLLVLLLQLPRLVKDELLANRFVD